MGTLLDAARVKAASRKRGSPCTIAVLRERNPQKASEIDELLANTGPAKELTYRVATDILIEAFEVDFKYDATSRHVRGECKCR